MNVIAGILIGVANDTWMARLVGPFIWGVVFCVSTSILGRDKRNAYVEHVEQLSHPLKWGMSPVQSFYIVEYMTAFSTSLLFSILTGFIKDLF